MNIHFVVQPSPEGLAHALIIDKNFVRNQPSALVMRDNIFCVYDLFKSQVNAIKWDSGASISHATWLTLIVLAWWTLIRSNVPRNWRKTHVAKMQLLRDGLEPLRPAGHWHCSRYLAFSESCLLDHRGQQATFGTRAVQRWDHGSGHSWLDTEIH